jgi:iron complex transport system ATP-binding protein
MNQTIPSTTPAIHLTNVGLRRGDTWILRHINWLVPAGACAAILGPNGSGKSTLTRILACHYWPTEGESSVLGSTFGDANLLDLRKSIRLVQPAGPYDIDSELTAHQVVLTGFFGTLGLYDPTTKEMEQEATHLLSQVGLSHVHNHIYATLSSGEKVRNLIARALVREPRLLLLDEPTSGLDLLAREQVLATVQALFDPTRLAGPLAGRVQRAHPPTVIFITHHVEELPPATSHVLLLDEGRAAAIGAPAEVLQDAVLSRVYKCPVEVRNEGGRYYVQVHPTAWRDLLNRPI